MLDDSSLFLPQTPGIQKGIRDVLAAQQDKRNFPASIDLLVGMIYKDYIPESTPLNKTKTFQVDTYYVNHPGGCIAYRFTETKADGSTVSCVVNTDYEPDEVWEERQLKIWEQATLVIADSQYEPPGVTNTLNPFMQGYGHSDYQTNIIMAQRAGVKQLLLTHHEPKMDDEYHTDLEKRAKIYAKDHAPSLENVCLAQEGNTYVI